MTLSIIELLEGVEALLFEVYKLVSEASNMKNFGSASFEDIIEAEGNYDFINQNLFSNNNLDQNSD